MTLENFTAEIMSDLSSYAQDRSIDKLSIKRWVINEFKIFGNNILDLKEKILQIENSKTELPEDFRSLKLALKIEPYTYEVNGNRDELYKSSVFKTRIETPAYFNEVTMEYEKSCDSKIIEDVITINNSSAKFYYRNPLWLSLTKNIDKSSLSVDCLNLQPSIRNSFKNEISIKNSTLNTNFKTGSIYIQYYGYPTDEDSEIVIPDTKIGALEKYLEYYVKSRIVENLIANNKNPQALTQIYQVYRQEAEKYKRTALTESRWAGLGKDWVKNFKTLNARDTAIFNLR